MTVAERFARLPTAGKLLLILTAVLLPIGAALAWLGEIGIRQANSALLQRSDDQARLAARSVESLFARNALALRIAANGALADNGGNTCDRARRSLAIAPAVSQNFELETPEGRPLCSNGTVGDTGKLPIVAPGDIRLRIAPDTDAVAVRVGVINGMATALVPVQELRTAADANSDVQTLLLHDAARELQVIGAPGNAVPDLRMTDWPVGRGALRATVGTTDRRITPWDRLVLLLPLLMWIAAAMITWLLVSRLLVRPLKRLERAVTQYQPGGGPLDLPRKLGPSEEIQELRDAFGRAVARVEQSDADDDCP